MSSGVETRLKIVPLFEVQGEQSLRLAGYQDLICSTLSTLLPSLFFENMGSSEETYDRQRKILKENLPHISCTPLETTPGTLSLFALAKYRANSFKFVFEMASRWLAPGRRLNVTLFCASDFRLADLGSDVYTLCEMMIRVEDAEEYAEIKRNFPHVRSEIVLGLHSALWAQRILDIKGVSADDKTALIQGVISKVCQRFPDHFNKEILTDMQQVLVSSQGDFIAARPFQHLCRLVCIRHLFRKWLPEAAKKTPSRRHIFVKVFRTRVESPVGRKNVLSIALGMNVIRDQDYLSEQNLLKAIQQCVPQACHVSHSFFSQRLGREHIDLVYIEIEKREEGKFTVADLRKLRKELPKQLKNRVEHRLHPVFMPRNEEDVMRTILALTKQVKYVRDLPQVSINFDEQAHAHICFTAIVARFVKPDTPSIADLFRRWNGGGEFHLDRVKQMGISRGRWVKEATVFRLKLPKDDFLRADHTIDLYKARQTVVSAITHMIGPIRDYNGGMIAKQHEALSVIRASLADSRDFDDLLLSNFFYSLSPDVVRALVDPAAFKKLFLMLLEGIDDYSSGTYLKVEEEAYNAFALVIIDDPAVKETLLKRVQELNIPSPELAQTAIKVHGYSCVGYICCARSNKKGELFAAIKAVIG